MADSFENRYTDVLQNIESAIVSTYRQHPEMSDRNVKDVLDALIRHYQVEARGHSLPAPRFTSPTGELYENVQSTCDWRLGEKELTGEGGQTLVVGVSPKTHDEIIACLKRIRLSIKTHKSGGRHGYLDFVSQFVP